MSKLKVKTFGGFDIFFGNHALSDKIIRRGKAWITLKFLIANYKRSVSTEELIDMLWGDSDSCDDPLNSLKNIVYRLRKTLSEYNKDIQYIGFSQGMYSWNPSVKCEIDAAEFEKLLSKARDDSAAVEERIELYKETLTLYDGEFLRGEGNELWLTNFTNYYRRLYLNAIGELAAIYEQQMAFEEIVLLYDEATKIEPYEESLYVQQIRMLINIGDYVSARRQYQNIERLLKKDFGAETSPELRNLYLEIGKTMDKAQANLTQIKTSLDDNVDDKTAIFCGPETFKRIYCYDKHLDQRIQFPIILGLVAVQFNKESFADSHESRVIMKTLRQIMVRTLRQCDIICQYSTNQFVLMLTAADVTNKMAALNRIERLFNNEVKDKDVQLHLQAITMDEDEFRKFDHKYLP